MSLASDGTKTLDVMCPAFAVECLETLEEIDGEVNQLLSKMVEKPLAIFRT